MPLIRSGHPWVRALLLGGIGLGGIALAASGAPADRPRAPDPAAGAATAETCAACHGADGGSNGPTWPRLAGQRAPYLEKQLRDFQAGTRADPAMTPMAQPLKPDQIADVAAYFAGLPRVAPRVPPADPAGAELYLRGRPSTNLAPCVGCHGGRGLGIDGVFVGGIPHLAGQQPDYVVKQLNDFASGARTNDDKGVMRAIARKLGDADKAALAAYIAGLTPPSAVPAPGAAP